MTDTLINALKQIAAMCPATSEMTVAHEMAQIAAAALAANTATAPSQPVEQAQIAKE